MISKEDALRHKRGLEALRQSILLLHDLKLGTKQEIDEYLKSIPPDIALKVSVIIKDIKAMLESQEDDI